MNKLLTGFFVLATFIVASCSKDELLHRVDKIRMLVSAETSVMYDLFDTEGIHPIECMLVMSEDNPGVWEQLAFGGIEGLIFERGHKYYLSVKRTILANPPMDGSDRIIHLLVSFWTGLLPS